MNCWVCVAGGCPVDGDGASVMSVSSTVVVLGDEGFEEMSRAWRSSTMVVFASNCLPVRPVLERKTVVSAMEKRRCSLVGSVEWLPKCFD